MAKHNNVTRAPGAVQLSSQALIATSPLDACQAQSNQTEQSTGLPIQLGGAAVSRRSFMNKLVSLPVAAAVTVVNPSIAAAADGLAAASLARLERVLEMLRTCYVCDGFKMDEDGAERALRYFRAGCPDDDEEWTATLRFLGSHNISTDWVLAGDAGVMICQAAARSEVALRNARSSDPTFAAIEKHRRACEAHDVEIVKTDYFEQLIPQARRKSSLRVDKRETVETDDPRWIEYQQLSHALYDAEWEATVNLAELKPTSTAGMLALLEYLDEYEEERGSAWPTLCEGDDDRWGKSFHYFVNRNLVESLRTMVA
jgi:hypothetical protein